MGSTSKEKKVAIENSDVRYFYPSLISYRSLRESLKKGTFKNTSLEIKHFECACEKHKNLLFLSVIANNTDILKVKKCEFNAKLTGKPIVNSAGAILLEGYQFYASHPDWKVRVSVVMGLSKFNTEEAKEMLSGLLNDKHKGVRLAAAQALEAMQSSPAKALPEKPIHQHEKNKTEKLPNKAIERIKSKLTKKRNKRTLRTIIASPFTKKIYHIKSKTHKLLIDKRILQIRTTAYFLRKHFNQYRTPHQYEAPYQRSKLSLNTLQSHEQTILIKKNRPSKRKTMQLKLIYKTHLFFKSSMPINRLDNKLNPVPGEIYWATTDERDPKITRPLLIIEAVNQKAGDFLAVPLTSDISSKPDPNMLVEIEGKASKIQIARKRIIHQSYLLNKCSNIPEDQFKKIRSATKNENPHNSPLKKPKPSQFMKSKLPKQHYKEDGYTIDNTQTLITTSPNVRTITKMPDKNSKNNFNKSKSKNISLLAFLTPEVKEHLKLEISDQDQTKQKITRPRNHQ